MANNSKKQAASSAPDQQPGKKRLESTDRFVLEINQALEAALNAGDNAGALEILDNAPSWTKREPEFMLARASLLLSMGYDQEAIELLREIQRKNPRFTAVNLPLAAVYMNNGCPAHALQAAKRAQADPDLEDDIHATVSQVVEEASEVIQSHASKLGLSFEAMQRACILDERAQMAMDESKFSEVDYFCREAIKIAPNWTSPYNNRAWALYFSGKTEEAISLSQSVLAREPEDTYTLSNLITFHLGLNQPEQAVDYGNRLDQLFDKLPPDSIDVENVITAFALLEDTPRLWKIARLYLKAPADSLFSRSWLCLAVAAIRMGNWKEARKLANKVDEGELSPADEDLRNEIQLVKIQKHPRLAWMPPAYPGVDLFLNPRILGEWDALTKRFISPLPPAQKRKMDEFLQKYPFIVAGMKRLLWDEAGHELALQILGDMDRPDTDAEIMRFIFSQAGNKKSRSQALMRLYQLGRYTGPEIVKLWDEDRDEWRDTELIGQRIGDVKPNARPETMVLIEKAQEAKDTQEAISLLRAAIKMEPTCPIAVFNLGVMLKKSGKEEEGTALLYRSVEVDPAYTYGHASIALSAADQGNEQEALDHLGVVGKADAISPDTAVIANMAWLTLALQKHDLDAARQRFELAVQIDPHHRLIEYYEKELKAAEDYDKAFGFLLDYQRQSIQRAHQKLLRTPLTEEMALLACLETNTKEMLVSTAHFLRTSSSGKKGELASWLAKVLLDPEFLQDTLEKNLEEEEREALRWVLEAGGVRPWKEFVQKYGDDKDESVYWNYHEPKSIPGRLRMSGLFYSGILEDQTVAFIPVDLRSLLGNLLK